MRAAVLGIPLAALCVGLALHARAADPPAEPASRAAPEAVEWFQEARFGMFIHWGVYSLLGRGEWVMNNARMTVDEYEQLPPRFNPERFDAAEWVRLAKDAGCRYITITAKHHDGFAMYHSRVSDYNIVDGTPFQRDVMKELAEECRRQGIRLFFYYSQLDWRHPDYFPRGRTGQHSGRPDAGEWERYRRFYIEQVRELCTQYGEIGGLWFDGWWDRPDADWGHEELYPMIHRLQPRALIGNNHHREPFPGEDFQMFEQDLPGENTAGFNTADASDLPYETCRTINRSWGYNQRDMRHRPVPELIRFLVQTAGRNANLLLNTGPLPDGTIQEEHRERFLAIGEWLRRNGESVYGTRGGPYSPAPWGVSTFRGRNVYLHVLEWPDDGVLKLGPLDAVVRGARGMHGGRVAFEQTGEGLTLTLPEAVRDPVDSIVVLELRDAPAERSE